MYFKQFLDERVGCASYLLASRQTNEAAIVDPAIETEPYETLLRERGFTLRYLIDTHVHADHVSGARKLARRVGGWSRGLPARVGAGGLSVPGTAGWRGANAGATPGAGDAHTRTPPRADLTPSQ